MAADGNDQVKEKLLTRTVHFNGYNNRSRYFPRGLV